MAKCRTTNLIQDLIGGKFLYRPRGKRLRLDSGKGLRNVRYLTHRRGLARFFRVMDKVSRRETRRSTYHMRRCVDPRKLGKVRRFLRCKSMCSEICSSVSLCAFCKSKRFPVTFKLCRPREHGPEFLTTRCRGLRRSTVLEVGGSRGYFLLQAGGRRSLKFI